MPAVCSPANFSSRGSMAHNRPISTGYRCPAVHTWTYRRTCGRASEYLQVLASYYLQVRLRVDRGAAEAAPAPRSTSAAPRSSFRVYALLQKGGKGGGLERGPSMCNLAARVASVVASPGAYSKGELAFELENLRHIGFPLRVFSRFSSVSFASCALTTFSVVRCCRSCCS